MSLVNSKFCVLGVNANGIRGQWSSCKIVINKLKTLVWNIQETKCVKEGGLKFHGYRVFENLKSNLNGGGGLAMGCSFKLSPVLKRSDGDEVQAFTLNIINIM